MYLQFTQVGDLDAFLDILPKTLFNLALIWRNELTVIFCDITESQFKFLLRLGTKFPAIIT